MTHDLLDRIDAMAAYSVDPRMTHDLARLRERVARMLESGEIIHLPNHIREVDERGNITYRVRT